MSKPNAARATVGTARATVPHPSTAAADDGWETTKAASRTPSPSRAAQTATNIKATPEVWGPLVRQPEPAARFARILHNAAQELWDVCTYDDAPQMWEEARAIASRILAAAGH